MKEINSLKAIFDCNYTEEFGTIAIFEPQKQAKIKQLNITSSDISFVSLQECFFDKVGNLFRKNSGCKKNADGAVFFYDSGGIKILFCELKSSKEGVSERAFHQVASSYIKVCMLLSICEGFILENLNIYFIFTAQESGDFFKYQTELEEVGSRTDFEEKQLKLLKGESVKIAIREIHEQNLPFKQELLEKQITCVLKTSTTDTIDLDVNTLLS